MEHNNRLTLLEAVALAGGVTRIAKGDESRLIRRSPMGREELTVNLQKVLYGGGPDMLLTDGDILFVPTSVRKEYTAANHHRSNRFGNDLWHLSHRTV